MLAAAAEHDHGDNAGDIEIIVVIPWLTAKVQRNQDDQFDGDRFGETLQRREADNAEIVALDRHEARHIHDRNARFDDDFEIAAGCVDDINRHWSAEQHAQSRARSFGARAKAPRTSAGAAARSSPPVLLVRRCTIETLAASTGLNIAPASLAASSARVRRIQVPRPQVRRRLRLHGTRSISECARTRARQSELIHRIARKNSQLVECDIELAVNTMLDQMARCLARGGRIEIRGIGSFSLRLRRARIGRAPGPGRRCRFPRGTRPGSSRGASCANASSATLAHRLNRSRPRLNRRIRSRTATADPSPATVMRIEALLRGHWPRPVPADAPDTLIGTSPHPRGRPKTSPPRMVPHAPSFESGDPVGSLVSPGTCQSCERDVAPAAARREAG